MAFICSRQMRNIFRGSRLINYTRAHREDLSPSVWSRGFFAQPYIVRLLSIQVQETPNPNSIKFVAGRRILEVNQASVEFRDANKSQGSPLAEALFKIEGVKTVYFGENFITVTKYDDNDYNWQTLKDDVVTLMTNYLQTEQPVILHTEGAELGVPEEDSSVEEDDTVDMIRELIETRIRPTVLDDGGDIVFRGFKDGIVKVKLLGACSSCPSSVVTLKRGVENMLQFYIPEVLGVEEVEDEIDAISKKEFEKLEKTLDKPH